VARALAVRLGLVGKDETPGGWTAREKAESGKLKAHAIRFSTLEAICRALDCQPGDILEYGNEDNGRNNT
jgi:hypothetical protein